MDQYFLPKKLQSQNVTREKLCKALSYKKFVHKMFMKFTTVVNFINILLAAFALIFFHPMFLER